MEEFGYQDEAASNPFYRLWSSLLPRMQTKTFGLVALLLIMAVLPITLFLAQQRQEIRQRASFSSCAANGPINKNGEGTGIIYDSTASNILGTCTGYDSSGDGACGSGGSNTNANGANVYWFTNCSGNGAGAQPTQPPSGGTCPDQCYSTELWVGIHSAGGACDNTHPDQVLKCPETRSNPIQCGAVGQNSCSCGGKSWYCDGWWKEGTRPSALEGNPCDPTIEGCREENGMRCWRFSQDNTQSQSVWFRTPLMTCNYARSDKAYCGVSNHTQAWYCQPDGHYGQTYQSPPTPTPSKIACGISFLKNGQYFNPFPNSGYGPANPTDSIQVLLTISRAMNHSAGETAVFADGSTAFYTNTSSTTTFTTTGKQFSAGTHVVTGSIDVNGVTICDDSAGHLSDRQQSLVISNPAQPTAAPTSAVSNCVQAGRCGVGILYYNKDGINYRDATCASVIANLAAYCAGTLPNPTLPANPLNPPQPTNPPAQPPPGSSPTVQPTQPPGVPPTVQPTVPSGNTTLAVSVTLFGPVTQTPPTSRNMTVCMYPPGSDPTSDYGCARGIRKDSTMNYDQTSTKFLQNSLDLGGTFTSGNYQIYITSPGFARGRVPQVVAISAGTSTALPTATLFTGDANGNSRLDPGDYDVFAQCYRTTKSADLTAGNQCKAADFDNSNKIDLNDYTVFAKALLQQLANQ